MASDQTPAMRLSVIVPTLNEAPFLGRTIASLRDAIAGAEIICADGGSTDATLEIARRHGAIVVRADRGRGAQLRAGAAAAGGDVLWFLHADTIVGCDARSQITAALADARVVAGNFRLLFDGASGGARFLNALYPKLARLGLRYGDSGIFVRRSTYEAAGGFGSLPIFEDLDLLRRLRKLGRITTLAGPLTTTSRRFDGRAFTPVFLRWTWLQILFWLGCDPARLGRMYHPPGSMS